MSCSSGALENQISLLIVSNRYTVAIWVCSVPVKVEQVEISFGIPQDVTHRLRRYTEDG